MRRAVALVGVLLAGVLVASGCSRGGAQDGMQSNPTLVAATPARSPASTGTLPGTVLPLPGDVVATAVDPKTRTVAVALDTPPSVRLYALDRLHAPPRTIPLPGAAASINLATPGGPMLVAVPSAGKLLRVNLRSATAHPVAVPGNPTGAARYGDRTLVAERRQHAVLVLDGDQVVKTITGQVNPQQVLVAGGQPVILDRLRSAVFDVNVDGGNFGAGLRAGQGAANAAVDNFGRVLATDTRTGALLAFSAAPVTKLQLSPVPGAPYGIAYDAHRHLAWITLTERNEVVGFDVAGGEPVERNRFATVRQPDTVAVDPVTGDVVVASAAGEGIQVIRP